MALGQGKHPGTCKEGDKAVPFLFKFRDIVERSGRHLMVERLVAVSEAGLADIRVCLVMLFP